MPQGVGAFAQQHVPGAQGAMNTFNQAQHKINQVSGQFNSATSGVWGGGGGGQHGGRRDYDDGQGGGFQEPQSGYMPRASSLPSLLADLSRSSDAGSLLLARRLADSLSLSSSPAAMGAPPQAVHGGAPHFNEFNQPHTSSGYPGAPSPQPQHSYGGGAPSFGGGGPSYGDNGGYGGGSSGFGGQQQHHHQQGPPPPQFGGGGGGGGGYGGPQQGGYDGGYGGQPQFGGGGGGPQFGGQPQFGGGPPPQGDFYGQGGAPPHHQGGHHGQHGGQGGYNSGYGGGGGAGQGGYY